MDGRGGTGHIVYFVRLDKDGLRQIVAHEFEIGLAKEMSYVALAAGVKIVQAQNVIALFHQAITKVGAQKTRPARNKYTFLIAKHFCLPFTGLDFKVHGL
jgi:hypothetical protein